MKRWQFTLFFMGVCIASIAGSSYGDSWQTPKKAKHIVEASVPVPGHKPPIPYSVKLTDYAIEVSTHALQPAHRSK